MSYSQLFSQLLQQQLLNQVQMSKMKTQLLKDVKVNSALNNVLNNAQNNGKIQNLGKSQFARGAGVDQDMAHGLLGKRAKTEGVDLVNVDQKGNLYKVRALEKSVNQCQRGPNQQGFAESTQQLANTDREALRKATLPAAIMKPPSLIPVAHRAQNPARMLQTVANFDTPKLMNNFQNQNHTTEQAILEAQYSLFKEQPQQEQPNIYRPLCQGLIPGSRSVGGVGGDVARKKAIAQTRYMDKQKLSEFAAEDRARGPPILPLHPTSLNSYGYTVSQTDPSRQVRDDKKQDNQRYLTASLATPLRSTNTMVKKAAQTQPNLQTGPIAQNFAEEDAIEPSKAAEPEESKVDLRDLRMQILMEIPQLVMHQSGPCQCSSAACRLNGKLLQYFLATEFETKQEKKQRPCKNAQSTQEPSQSIQEPALQASEQTSKLKESQQRAASAQLDNEDDKTSKSSKQIQSNDEKSSEELPENQFEAPLDKEIGDKEQMHSCKDDCGAQVELAKDEGKAAKQGESGDSDAEDKLFLKDFQRQQAKPVTMCPHTNRKHYAKNMCSSCYRKFGRNQNATRCGHTDRLLYSMGMCQTCYMADYHQRRTKPMKKYMKKQVQTHDTLRARIDDKNSSTNGDDELVNTENETGQQDE